MKNKVYLVIILAVLAVVYFLTLAVNHNEAEDSLNYLYSISYGTLSDQFHPDHLLYNYINHLFFNFWKLLGYEGSAELPVKLVNIAAALSVLWLLYIILSHLNFPHFLRYFSVIFLAFSYGFWWYSVECEVYIFSFLFILLSLHRLILVRKDFFKFRNHLVLGIFNATAILFHKLHIFFIPVIVLGYLLIFYENRKKLTWNKLIRALSAYAVICGFLVLFVYLGVAVSVMGLSNLKDITSWALHLNALTGKLGCSLSDIPKALVGFCRFFIGGHYFFSLSAVTDFMKKVMPFLSLREELFLVKDFSLFKGFALYLLSLLVFFLSLYIVLQIKKQGILISVKSDGSELARLRRFVAILITFYFFTYSLSIFIFSEPLNIESWIFAGPMAIIALGLLTVPIIHRIRVRSAVGIILACLFFVNLFGSVLPQRDLEHDYWHNFNSWLIKNCRAGDLVVSGSGSLPDGYIRYYSQAKVFSTLEFSLNLEKKFQEALALWKPENIYFSSTVCEPIKQDYLGNDFDNSHALSLFSKLSENLVLVHSDSYQKIFLYKKDKNNIIRY